MRAFLIGALRLHFMVMLLAVALPGAVILQPQPATAQTSNNSQGDIDYDLWERRATGTELALGDSEISNSRLETLRAQMVKWRETFQSVQDPNAARIAVLKGQIDALGPPPEDGASEPDAVAARRIELNNMLEYERAPARRAAEAYGRADTIIQQIDQKLRERRTSALLHLSPSPVLPSSWAAALGEAAQWGQAALSETRNRFDRMSPDQMRAQLPSELLLLFLVVLTMTFGRRFVHSLPENLSARASYNARRAVEFAVSLLQIMLPYVGVRLAVAAIRSTGLSGAYLQPVIDALPTAALVYLVTCWIVLRLFPADLTTPTRLRLSEEGARSMRRHGLAVAVALGVFALVSPAILPLSGLAAMHGPNLLPPQPFTEAAAGAWHLPLILLTSLLLFRLGGVLRACMDAYQVETAPYRYRVAAALGGVSRVIALVVPVLAVIGYVTAANSLLWPWLNTLGLVALVLLLQGFIDGLWVIIKGGEEGASNALAPVLIGFGLALAALPLLALIWGAQSSDLVELWMQVRNGLRIGGITVSPAAILTFFAVFAIAYLLTRALQVAVGASILPKTRIEAGAQNAIVAGLGYIGISLAALLAITAAGINLASLAIVAGALSVGIGFGLQNIVSNFVSGIILLIERPITVGDWIKVGEYEGTVERISVRSTMINTFDRADVVVPNSDLISSAVINKTRRNLLGRVIVPVTVSYDNDSRHVARVLLEIAEDQPLVMVNPAPGADFTGFGDNGMNFQLRVILSDINQFWAVTNEIRHQIAERFAEEGIKIPYGTRDIRLHHVSPGEATEQTPDPAG